MRMPFLALMLTVGTLGGATAAAAQADFQWRGAVAPGRTLEVRGVTGDIRAMAATDGEVRVEAARSARRSDPESVRIQVVEHAGGVTVCAVYPTPASSAAENECRPGGGTSSVRNNDVRVDFVVRVPAGVHLAAHTVNGEVRAEDLRADVQATTVNGGVSVRTSGFVTRATTVNGDVVLELPAATNADFVASTVNGSIDSDFPVTVSGSMGRRNLRGTIGEGGRELRATTVNGSIRLRRL